MKPTNFEFARATSLAEAATILRQAAGTARVVAGGQSLGPMLNLRLVQPSILVDITAIPELTHIEEDADGVVVGACVTTSDIEDGRVRVAELPILASVAGGVAYRAVRNRGTIGGSICHADPAGDWLPTLCALAAECIVTDGRRARRVPIDQFVTGAFEVMLEPGELLQAICIPRPSRAARCGYYKVCRKAGSSPWRAAQYCSMANASASEQPSGRRKGGPSSSRTRARSWEGFRGREPPSVSTRGLPTSCWGAPD